MTSTALFATNGTGSKIDPRPQNFFIQVLLGKILIITHGIKELQIQEFLRMLQTFSFAKSSCCGSYLIQRNVRVITISYQWWAERLGLNFRLKLNRIIVIFHTVEREKKVFGLYKGTGLAWGIRASCPKFHPQLAVNTYYILILKLRLLLQSEVAPDKKKMNLRENLNRI